MSRTSITRTDVINLCARACPLDHANCKYGRHHCEARGNRGGLGTRRFLAGRCFLHDGGGPQGCVLCRLAVNRHLGLERCSRGQVVELRFNGNHCGVGFEYNCRFCIARRTPLATWLGSLDGNFLDCGSRTDCFLGLLYVIFELNCGLRGESVVFDRGGRKQLNHRS